MHILFSFFARVCFFPVYVVQDDRGSWVLLAVSQEAKDTGNTDWPRAGLVVTIDVDREMK